jgi:hypothetical protein
MRCALVFSIRYLYESWGIQTPFCASMERRIVVSATAPTIAAK